MPNSFLGFPVRRALLADYALKTGVSFFTHRDSPATVDWDADALDKTGDPAVLDCSAIVPPGATWILFTIAIRAGAGHPDAYAVFKSHGEANFPPSVIVAGGDGNHYVSGFFFIPCDADRLVDYIFHAGTYQNIELTVTGWA